MLTDAVRDHAFTIAWFGLMAFVWFGWGQEDPPPQWRWRLGLGSGLGLLLAGVFGYVVATQWRSGSALDGQYPIFGALVLLEVLAAGVGCLLLWRRRQQRWMAWWVALVVALHFIPLAVFLADASLAALGMIQAACLGAIIPRLRTAATPTSRLVGPVMGGSLITFAVVSLLVFLTRYGLSW